MGKDKSRRRTVHRHQRIKPAKELEFVVRVVVRIPKAYEKGLIKGYVADSIWEHIQPRKGAKAYIAEVRVQKMRTV